LNKELKKDVRYRTISILKF